MYLRHPQRRKNGKEPPYWSLVESRRLADGRVSQRHVLYLGEINDAQERAWARAVAVFPDENGPPQTMALFPEDCLDAPVEGGLPLVRLRPKGGCVASGSRAVRWAICWEWISRWPIRTSSTAVTIRSWLTRAPCSRIWWSAGGVCSGPNSLCSCRIRR